MILQTESKNFDRKQGLSQEKFALKIDMDRTYYASVEAGKRNISIKNIKKIADGFELSLEELFKGMWGVIYGKKRFTRKR